MALFTLIVLLVVTMLTATAAVATLWYCLREPRAGRGKSIE